MRYRIITLICLLILVTALCGDELGDKQKQLNKVQSDLQKAEKKVEQNEAKKNKNKTEISNTLRTKQKTDVELRRTQEVAREKLQSLNLVNTELGTVEKQIRDLKVMHNIQLDKMLRISRKNGSIRIVHKDQHCLALLASQTKEKLSAFSDVQIDLVGEQNQKGREFTLANSEFKEKSTTSLYLNSKVKNLESQQSQLTNEQKKLQNQIAKLKKDASQLESLIANLTTRPKAQGQEPASYKFSARTIAWPIKGSIIRSYGQETRAYGTSVVCNGIDIAAPEWATVVAADAGEVVYSGTYGGQGKLLIIDHKNGFFTVYAYNNELLVSTGTTVKKGQAIAKSGITGSATEPSLHFEVRKDGKAVNPLSYLE